jgi:hypothetical protein
MQAGKNSVIYMGLISGPNKADDTCGRTTVTGTMDIGFTVFDLRQSHPIAQNVVCLVKCCVELVQDTSPDTLMHCLIVFPFFLNYFDECRMHDQ